MLNTWGEKFLAWMVHDPQVTKRILDKNRDRHGRMLPYWKALHARRFELGASDSLAIEAWCQVMDERQLSIKGEDAQDG